MSNARILAISSSRVGNSGYLENALPLIKDFLGNKPLNIAFVPFAAVTISFEKYLQNVQAALHSLNHTFNMVQPNNAKAIIENADVIMIGGGNTFKLLSMIYQTQILDVVRNKVNSGTPYIGWSAGSNIIGPTIATTNDMPIVEPKSFNALGLFPFQINPHYYNVKPEGFNGETRDQRLTEFIIENHGVSVVCLPEGIALHYEKNVLKLIGQTAAILLEAKEDSLEIQRKEIMVGEDISRLM